jgi:hypothetical protein
MLMRLGARIALVLTAISVAVRGWAADSQFALVGGMLLDGTGAPPVHHTTVLKVGG